MSLGLRSSSILTTLGASFKFKSFNELKLRAYGADPPLAPTQLAGLYRRLMALYELRLDAQYRALAVPLEQAQNGVQTALDVMQHVRRYKFGEVS